MIWHPFYVARKSEARSIGEKFLKKRSAAEPFDPAAIMKKFIL